MRLGGFSNLAPNGQGLLTANVLRLRHWLQQGHVGGSLFCISRLLHGGWSSSGCGEGRQALWQVLAVCLPVRPANVLAFALGLD